MKRRTRIALALLLGIPLLGASALLLYLNFADLSGWRTTVERVASDAIGRELRIGGKFRPEIGLTTRLVAGDVTLANPRWSDDRHMVAVESLDASIDLLSLIRGPITLRDVEISGARVVFEVGENGRFNWDINAGAPPQPPGPDVELVIADAALRDVSLVYAQPGRPELEANIAQLGFSDDGTGMLELGLEGSVMQSPFAVSGRLGTLVGLINATSVSHDLTGTLAGIEFSTEGAIADLGSLRGVDGRVSILGKDVGQILAPFGIGPIAAGPFEVSASVEPASDGQVVEVSGRAGEIHAEIVGVVDRLAPPGSIEAQVQLSGHDVRALARLAGIDDLPQQRFSVNGGVTWQGFPITLSEVLVRVGPNSLEASGVLGRPPAMLGTDLRFDGDGPDVSVLAAVAGIRMPRDDYAVHGRLIRTEHGVRAEEIEVRVGQSEVLAHGVVGDPPEYAGTSLQLEASVHRPDRYGHLVGRPLPEETLTVSGGFTEEDGAIDLEDIVARLGEHRIRVDGRIRPDHELVGSELQVRASGPDFSRLAGFAGLEGAPSIEYEIAGGLRVRAGGFDLRDVAAKVGEIEGRANGTVFLRPGLLGTTLDISGSGRDLGDLAWLTGLDILPNEDFDFAGAISVGERHYELAGTTARVGTITATADGVITDSTGFEGTELDLTVDVPDLQRIGSLAAAFIDLPQLPAERLVVRTRLTIDEQGYLLDGLDGSLGRTEFSADGRLGHPPRLVGTDLTIEAGGPDVSLVNTATGLKMPVAPFEVTGRLERLENSIRFHRVEGRIGEHQVSVDGSLGELPKLIATDLEVHASGPDTDLYERLFGIPNLPELPFTLDGRFSGTPERFSGREFKIKFGRSDLQGFFSVDFAGKPTVEARLDSHILDLSQFRKQLETTGDASHQRAKAEVSKTKKGALLFPDQPMNLYWLQAVDAEVAIQIGHLYLPTNQFRDITVDVHLEDGRLAIDRMTAAGRGDGLMTGSLLFEPSLESHRLDAEIAIRQVRFDPPEAMTELMQRPPIDIDIDLQAVGATPHQLASSTTGAVKLVIGDGIFDSSTLDLVTADILLTLINALNPFAKEDPTTELECGAALLIFDDGLARLEPMAFQSNTMTLLGEGRIDFETEKLNLRWVTKPRKGIGISASMITNPYIKLGGTLADPSIELKPIEAVTSTGVAVATLGLSLVAKGMFDRITAERKVCTKVLEQIDARARAASDAPKSNK
jgi:uncharacterized protein involved in outer membrane biogenesis